MYISKSFNQSEELILETLPDTTLEISKPLDNELKIIEQHEDGYIIRLAQTQKDFSTIINTMAKKERWNPGLHDSKIFPMVDKEGWFIGEINGNPICCINCVKWNDDYGYISHYICDKNHRGKGYGIKIWKVGMKHIESCKNLALDAEKSMSANFEKSGFKPEFISTRYSGAFNEIEMSPNIVSIKEVNIEQINLLYYECTGINRLDFLELWLNQPKSAGFCYIKNYQKDLPISEQELLGIGHIRPASGGFRIGPLFVRSSILDPDECKHVARSLLLALAYFTFSKNPNIIGSGLLAIDVPQCNESAIELMKELKFTPIWECARMYTNGPLNQNHKSWIYGMHNWEVGP